MFISVKSILTGFVRFRKFIMLLVGATHASPDSPYEQTKQGRGMPRPYTRFFFMFYWRIDNCQIWG